MKRSIWDSKEGTIRLDGAQIGIVRAGTARRPAGGPGFTRRGYVVHWSAAGDTSCTKEMSSSRRCAVGKSSVEVGRRKMPQHVLHQQVAVSPRAHRKHIGIEDAVVNWDCFGGHLASLGVVASWCRGMVAVGKNTLPR